MLGVAALATFFANNRTAWTTSLQAALPPLADVAQKVGLGLDQIAVTGHKFTSDEAIFKALDLAAARHLIGYDSEAARLRVEALPWVATVELRRLYPGQLNVHITERAAFAVWAHDGREELVDKTGRVLQSVPAGSITHLPRVSGEGAGAAAADLMFLLARFQPLAKAFASAERVEGRRWSVRLGNGGRIELPADGEALALAGLDTDGQLDRLASRPPVIVDLRAPGRIATRPADVKAAAVPRSVAGIEDLIEKFGRDGGTP